MGKESSSSSSSVFGCMFLVLMTLKLLHKIDISWWWVTAPLWGGFAITFALLFGAIVVAVLASRNR